ncbi:MAG: sulfatase [Bacteroidota bacterium]
MPSIRSIPVRLILAFSVAFFTSTCTADRHSTLSGTRPNIIFILADDMGWADLPVYGNRFNEAPNLTRMAENGMRFTDAYAACPVCSPTRASIMSGQYPARVGVIDFIPGHWRPYEEVTVPSNRTQYLPQEIITIGETMQEAGYATGYFGKWHLGNPDGHYPQNQGFDVANVYQGGGFHQFAGKMSTPIEEEEGVVLSEALTSLSLDFMEQNREEPFFLFLAHYDVHVQLDADSALIDKYLKKEKVEGYPGNAVYAAMVEHVDNSVGQILDKLEELHLSENTLVVYFSDNGGLISRFDRIPLLAHSKQYIYEGDTLLYIASSNAPLRAEKGTIYEGGIREPFIVQWPGMIEAGQVSDAVVTSVDFYPTFAELAGISLPEEQEFDGESLLPVFSGQVSDPERAIFWHYPVYHHDKPASVIRKGDWKLIHYLVDDSRLLYNLAEDIGETTDLSTIHSNKTEALMNLLDQWRKEVGAETPVPNPDFDPEKREQWGRHPR